MIRIIANSAGKGNYNESEIINRWKGTKITTGALPAYAEKNIYNFVN